MKLLLLSQNPVVNKLVALSAQKRGDELIVATGMAEVDTGGVEVLIVDEASYEEGVLQTLAEQTGAQRKLFMAAKGQETPAGFDATIAKPFLPTDLLKMLTGFEEELNVTVLDAPEETPAPLSEAVEDFDAGDVPQNDEDADVLEFDLPEALSEDLDEPLPDFEESLPDLEEEIPAEAEPEAVSGEPVLDEEELKEVQSLLEDEEELGEEAGADAVGLKSETLDEVKAALDDLEFDDSDLGLDGLEDEEGEAADFDLGDLDLKEELEAPLHDDPHSQDTDAGAALTASEPETDDAALETVFEQDDLNLEALETELPAEEAPESDAEALDTEDFDLGDLDFETETQSASDAAVSEEDAELGALDLPENETFDDTESEAFDLGDLELGTAEADAAEAAEPEAAEEAIDFDLGDLDVDVAEREAEAAAEVAEADETPVPDAEENVPESLQSDISDETEPETAAEDDAADGADATDFGLGDLDLEGAETEDAAAEEPAADTAEETEQTEAIDFDLGELDLESPESEAAFEDDTELGAVEPLEEEGAPEIAEALSDASDTADDSLAEAVAEPVDLGDIGIDEAMDEDAESTVSEAPEAELAALEAQIESAVSQLSEDELAEEVDEATLLNIVNAADDAEQATEEVPDEMTDDAFDSLDADALKAALGELPEETAPEADEVQAPESGETAEPAASIDVSSDAGLDALRTLLKALESEETARSLKGMNVNINITFGAED